MQYNILFIILYFVALTIVIATGRKKTSPDEYLIASRNLGVWPTVSTLFSTYRNASGFVALVTLGVIFELGAVWLTMGMLLALVYLYTIVPKIRRLSDDKKLLTIPDYFNEVYGQGSAFLTAILIVVMGLIFVIAQFYVSSRVLVALLPISLTTSVFLVGIPIVAYLMFRGYTSVVRTDIFQWFIILLFLVVPFWLIGERSHLDVQIGSLLSPTWKGIVGFIVSGFFVTLMGADTWQRLYSARSVQTARKALLITGPAFFIFNAIIVLFGMLLGSILGGISPDQVFYEGFKTALPPIAGALLLTILFASIMSTIDTYVFINSLTFVKNLLMRESKDQSKIVQKTRYVIPIFLLLAMVLALIAGDFLNLVFGATTILTIMAPSAVYSFYRYKGKHKLNDMSTILSLVLGSIVHIPLFFLGKFQQPVYLLYPIAAAFVGLLIGQFIFKKDKGKLSGFNE